MANLEKIAPYSSAEDEKGKITIDFSKKLNNESEKFKRNYNNVENGLRIHMPGVS